MRQSPSIVPEAFDRDIYLVLDDFGHHGRAWCETAETDTERGTLLRHLLEGQYHAPVRIVAFNPAEGWSRDVTEDMAYVLAARSTGDLPEAIAEFIEDNIGWRAPRQLELRL
jgi:hypothetical protein